MTDDEINALLEIGVSGGIISEEQAIASKAAGKASREKQASSKAKADGKTKDQKDERAESDEGEYDPAPIAKAMSVYWLNGADRYYKIREEPKGVLSWNAQDVKRALRLNGVFSRAIEGKAYSQADKVITYIQEECGLDYAGPVAGKRIGLIDVQGRRVLVTSTFKRIEPIAGEWIIIKAILSGMLCEQVVWLYAWLKTALESLRKGENRPGHGLILAGPSDCGKSFIQEHIITALFGGRSANPEKYLLGKTTFNAEMAGAEHLAMSELPSGLDFKSRAALSESLKQLITTDSHSIHPKYQDALTLYPWWRVSLSINNNVDRLKAFPSLGSDFGDKILLLLCQSKPMPMPSASSEERKALRAAIASELPAFAAFLLNWEIPSELRKSEHASRFGHDSFHHPELAAALFEQEPQSSLLYILDNCPELYVDGVWGWDTSDALRDQILEGAECSRFAAQARKIFSFTNSAGTFISKLREKFPERFLFKHTNARNVWQVLAPEKK